jgi:hypothetical protein
MTMSTERTIPTICPQVTDVIVANHQRPKSSVILTALGAIPAALEIL